MSNAGEGAGGPQPEKIAQQASTTDAEHKGRLDGITKLVGTVTFGASAVSINVTVDPYNATASGFTAEGSPGNSISSTATSRTATRTTNPNATPRTDVVAASSLDNCTPGTAYTVRVKYTSGGACSKTGTVAGSSVVRNTTQAITLI
ncbi:MAG: hypothetical protein ACYTG2_07385 [Planctomycetota bacterium]|jgi:hypothetical protein